MLVLDPVSIVILNQHDISDLMVYGVAVFGKLQFSFIRGIYTMTLSTDFQSYYQTFSYSINMYLAIAGEKHRAQQISYGDHLQILD